MPQDQGGGRRRADPLDLELEMISLDQQSSDNGRGGGRDGSRARDRNDGYRDRDRDRDRNRDHRSGERRQRQRDQRGSSHSLGEFGADFGPLAVVTGLLGGGNRPAQDKHFIQASLVGQTNDWSRSSPAAIEVWLRQSGV